MASIQSHQPADELVLVGQQLAFYQALAEQDGCVASWCLGARITLLNLRNLERLEQAGHSLRELMDKLHPWLDRHGLRRTKQAAR